MKRQFNKLFILVCTCLLIACSQESNTNSNQQATDNGFENSFVSWGKQNAIPIVSLTNSTDNSDLEAIGKAIGDVRVVALSEGFHNCKEMMALHHRIIQYLVEHHGFNTIATESGLPESRAINQYIKGDAAPDNMWQNNIAKMYSQWKEGRDLIEWMRTYNTSNNNELSYYGIDIGGFYQNWKTPLEKIIGYLTKVDPKYGQYFFIQLTPYLHLLKEDARVNYSTQLSAKQQAELALILDDAVQHFNDNQETYIAQSNNDDFQWFRQSTVAMQLAENYYRNYLNMKHPENSKYVGLNGREIAMSRNLSWVLEYRADAKVILIDHVIHTKTATQAQEGIWGIFTPAGQLIKQYLKDDLFIIGMAYGGGKYWNEWQQPENRYISDIPPSLENGIEHTLAKIELKNFFLNWENN